MSSTRRRVSSVGTSWIVPLVESAPSSTSAKWSFSWSSRTPNGVFLIRLGLVEGIQSPLLSEVGPHRRGTSGRTSPGRSSTEVSESRVSFTLQKRTCVGWWST